MKKILLAGLALISTIAISDTGTLTIDANGGLSLKCDSIVPPGTNGECPPPPPAPAPLPSIGNLHGAIHPTLAKTDRTTCNTCHKASGSALVKFDKVICAQFDFKYPGRTLIDPATGKNAVDPISGTQVVSGGRTAVLKQNDLVRCADCHYPHKTANVSVSERNIHTGCLDCHVKIGSGDLQPGIKD